MHSIAKLFYGAASNTLLYAVSQAALFLAMSKSPPIVEIAAGALRAVGRPSPHRFAAMYGERQGMIGARGRRAAAGRGVSECTVTHVHVFRT